MEKVDHAPNQITPLLPKFKQVGMTFVSHRWLAIGNTLAALLCLQRLFFSRENEASQAISTIGISFFWVAGTLTSLVLTKYWFTRPDAKLTPGYRAPHLMLVGLILWFQYFLIPILLAPHFGIDPVGAAAFAICLTCSLLWAIDNPRYLIVVFLIGGTIAIPSIRDFWFESDLPYQLQRAILLIAGWGLTIYWLLRQSSMSEENDGYVLPQFALAMGTATRRLRTQQNQVIAKQLKRNRLWANLSDLVLDSALSKKNVSPNRLTGKGFMAGPLPIGVTQAIIFTLIFAVVIQTTKHFFPDTKNVAWSMLNQPLMFSLIMPGMMLQQLWSMKKPIMASELLRENQREAYFKTLFFSSLKQTLYGTLAFWIGAIALVYAYGERPLTTLAISCFLAMVISSNSFFASFSILGASFRSKIAGIALLTVPMMLVIGIFMGLLFSFRKQLFGPHATNDFLFVHEPSVFLSIYLGSFLIFMVSLIILRIAYKKWLRTELG